MSDLGVPRHLLDLARQARGPRALTSDGLRERFGEFTDLQIQAGQVWRARWENVVALLLVLSVQSRTVTAAPVTIDPPAEDEHSLIIYPDRTVFGAEVTLWGGMVSQMPTQVLERPVDAWAEEIVQWATAEATSSYEDVPQGTRRGRGISTVFASDALVQAELRDDLDALCAAPALPTTKASDRPFRSLASLLGEELKLEVLCAALGWPQYEVMQLLQGRRFLTSDMVEAVARATGVPVRDVAHAVRPLPAELVAEVDHPRWRSTWRTLAESRGQDEATVRMTTSYETLALAARQTGSGGIDWRARLRQVLQNSAVQQRQGR